MPGRTQKAANPVGQALRMVALPARRNQTFLGAWRRGRGARKGTPAAITATAPGLACLMVARSEECAGKGMAAYRKRRIDRPLANLHRKAKSLGCQLIRPAAGQEVSWDGMG